MAAAYDVEDYGALVIITVLRITSDDEYQFFLDDLSAAYRRVPRLAFVIDPSSAPNLPTSQRTMLGQWLSANDAMVRRQCLGLAFVFTSAVSRFVLSSIFLLWPPSCPYAVCASRAEALQRIGPWLRIGGIDPTPLLVRANKGSTERQTSA